MRLEGKIHVGVIVNLVRELAPGAHLMAQLGREVEDIDDHGRDGVDARVDGGGQPGRPAAFGCAGDGESLDAKPVGKTAAHRARERESKGARKHDEPNLTRSKSLDVLQIEGHQEEGNRGADKAQKSGRDRPRKLAVLKGAEIEHREAYPSLPQHEKPHEGHRAENPRNQLPYLQVVTVADYDDQQNQRKRR